MRFLFLLVSLCFAGDRVVVSSLCSPGVMIRVGECIGITTSDIGREFWRCNDRVDRWFDSSTAIPNFSIGTSFAIAYKSEVAKDRGNLKIDTATVNQWPVRIFVSLKHWRTGDSTQINDVYLLSQTIFHINKYNGKGRISGIEYIPMADVYLIKDSPSRLNIHADVIIDCVRLLYSHMGETDTVVYQLKNSYFTPSVSCFPIRFDYFPARFFWEDIALGIHGIPFSCVAKPDSAECCEGKSHTCNTPLDTIFLPFRPEATSALKGSGQKICTLAKSGYFDALGRPSKLEMFKISLRKKY